MKRNDKIFIANAVLVVSSVLLALGLFICLVWLAGTYPAIGFPLMGVLVVGSFAGSLTYRLKNPL